jgi:hypothetical protein
LLSTLPPSLEKTGVLACVQRAIKHLAIHKKSEIAVVPDKENFRKGYTPDPKIDPRCGEIHDTR